MGKKCLRMLLTAVTAVSLLTGCGSSKGMMNMADTAAYESAPAAEPAAMAEEYLYDAGYGYDATVAEAEEAPAGEIGGGAENNSEEVNDPQTGRKLITTMNVSAETENFDALMGNLEQQITALGGYIESSDQWNGSTDYYGNRIHERNASLTVRIPAEKLNSFLTMVEESSNITNKSKNVEDVTLAYVDLESHKKALLTAEERLLELLEKAETVEDLITIEEKLTEVRYQLESMESQLRTYDNKINYSTVYLNVQEVKRLTPVEEPTTWGRIKTGFEENVYNVCVGIRDFFVGLIVNIPYIILWLIILAVVLFIVFLLAKREKKKKEKRMLQRQQMTGTGLPDGALPYGVRREEPLSGKLRKTDNEVSAPEAEQVKKESLQAGQEAEPAKEEQTKEEKTE